MRYTIRGLLVVQSPVIIPEVESGAPASGQEEGVWGTRIPAATLAGALREHVDNSLDSSLWGTLGRRPAISVSEGRRVVDKEVQLPVRISLVSVTTSETKQGRLRVDAALPSGAQYDVQMALDDPRPGELTRLLTALVSGFRLGNRTQSGYGRVHMRALQVSRETT